MTAAEPDEARLHDGDGERAVTLEDAPLGQAPPARSRRALLIVEGGLGHGV